MLRVFLTVDTEVWPFVTGWPVRPLDAAKTQFDDEIRGYIYGATESGEYGLPRQLDILRRHGLKATYFVEPLFSGRAGHHFLLEITRLIHDGGQEVQLHLHTEWLAELKDSRLPRYFRQHVHQFSEDEQAAILSVAKQMLEEATRSKVCAFRAGNYGASIATLQALTRAGIQYDSSHNTAYLGEACKLEPIERANQPSIVAGIVEVPVSCFYDAPGHVRHAQLCACSFAEMRAALLAAWRAGWSSFVVVLHGFELVRHVRDPGRRTPDRVVNQRFEHLCEFLATNTDKFMTTHFRDLQPEDLILSSRVQPISTGVHRTAWRILEQLGGRIRYGA